MRQESEHIGQGEGSPPSGGRHRRWRRGVSTVTALLCLSGLAIGTSAAAGPAPSQATSTSTQGAGSDEENPVSADYSGECPWMDTSASPAERARMLLDASSLEQTMRWLVEQPAGQPERTDWPDGVTYPEQVACTPDITFANGAHGASVEGGTAFPAPIAEAATWQEGISFEKGQIVAEETFRSGRNVLLGPGMAGGRNPLSGRTSEYYGEDPILSGSLAGANASGLESLDQMPVVANLKHYVANEQELDRDLSSSNIDERALRQIYDLSFEIAAEESEAGSIMCSYNQVNGQYACENPIMQEHIKDDWGYEGFIMSDFGSVHSTVDSLDAGLDMELNRPIHYAPDRLHEALDAGDITEGQIVGAAKRVVTALFSAGIFDAPLPEEPETSLRTDEAEELALRMAEEGSVLLSNDGVLPLQTDQLDVAVVGAWASNDDRGGTAASDVCSSYLPFGSAGTAVACPSISAPLDAITQHVESLGGSVTYADGSDTDEVAAAAEAADVVLAFGHQIMGETSDLETLHLDGDGDEVIAAAAEANSNTVAVVAAGSAVAMPWLDDVGAVLHTWYPGIEMGTAITNLLWGETNPSGKLPMTFPESMDDSPIRTEEQYPGVFEDGSTERTDEEAIRQVNYTEGMQVGYRWYQAQGIDPLFEFGHGLSYTDFEYDNLRVTPKSTSGDEHMDIKFRLTNTGETAGREVAQVYLELPAEADEPSARLIAWESVELEPGEHENVRIRLDSETLQDRHLLEYWDTDSDDWQTPSGSFTVTVGSSSEELLLTDTMTVR